MTRINVNKSEFSFYTLWQPVNDMINTQQTLNSELPRDQVLRHSIRVGSRMTSFIARTLIIKLDKSIWVPCFVPQKHNL